jgi:diadenosine tetraphosphatase ApaH/serine/threonine PP2A family protein phosphatase
LRRFWVLAILSDIHGNLEALQAVLADAATHGIDQFVCLGDTVGYGPDQLECVKLTMSWPVVLQGNFESAALSSDDLVWLMWGNSFAVESVIWFRAVLAEQPQPCPIRQFLTKAPYTQETNGMLFVHGTPRDPLYDYVYPEDMYNPRKMERIFPLIERYCFHGHTHIPGIFTHDSQYDSYQFQSPKEIDYLHKLGGHKTMINVGSVGQPRDGDWRACYVLLDWDVVRFRRVEYDIETTVKKIYANPHLDNFLGNRLREGR